MDHRSHVFSLAVLALGGTGVFAPSLARAQAQTESAAFTWEGRIPEGRWIVVHNLNGTIYAERGTSDRVEVVATRRTRRGDPNYVRFEVTKFGPSEQDVSICAIWGENQTCNENGYRSRGDRRNRENDVFVEFRVKVPAGVKVGVHSVNGEVRAEGIPAEIEASSVNGAVLVRTDVGPVNASTVNGSVRAMMGRFDGKTDMRFSSVNGSVIAEFAGDLDADVELSTVNGRFLTDYPVTIRGRIDPRRLRATLGNGGARIRLTTVNGNVELRKR